MAKINLTKMIDAEEYSDKKNIKGFRKNAWINNQAEDVRMSETPSFVSGRTKRDYIISLRKHERSKFRAEQLKKQELEEIKDANEEPNA